MPIEVLTHAVLTIGALGTSYVVVREYDVATNGERRAREVTLELGSVFAFLLWGVVSFNSFNVVSAADGVARTHTGFALLAGGMALIMGFVAVAAVFKGITPERSRMEAPR